MKLLIRKERKPEFGNDTYYLSTDMLEMKAVHMFIAYHKWETIDIELSDEIPGGYLRFFNKVCSDIRVLRTSVCSAENLTKQLSELFPELGGKIRKAYFTGKDVWEVIPECHVS